MKSRPIAAAFFVVLCLLLCGLILRRQISAHPLPPDTTGQLQQQGFSGGLQDGRLAAPDVARQAQETVQNQLTALHDGDGLKAMSYQSRSLRQMFGTPAQFEQMMTTQYPEFARCRQAYFGPVWTDSTGNFVHVHVIVDGENGHRARGGYLLVREAGQWKIDGVRTQRLPDEEPTPVQAPTLPKWEGEE